MSIETTTEAMLSSNQDEFDESTDTIATATDTDEELEYKIPEDYFEFFKQHFDNAYIAVQDAKERYQLIAEAFFHTFEYSIPLSQSTKLVFRATPSMVYVLYVDNGAITDLNICLAVERQQTDEFEIVLWIDDTRMERDEDEDMPFDWAFTLSNYLHTIISELESQTDWELGVTDIAVTEHVLQCQD